MTAGEAALAHAQNLGRQRQPLSLRRYGRTLALRHDPQGDALVIHLVSGQTERVACSARIAGRARPVVTVDELTHHNVRFGFHPDEQPKVSAWLTGYFGDDA